METIYYYHLLGNQPEGGKKKNLYNEFILTALETSHARHPGKCSTVREPTRRTSHISAKTFKRMWYTKIKNVISLAILYSFAHITSNMQVQSVLIWSQENNHNKWALSALFQNHKHTNMDILRYFKWLIKFRLLQGFKSVVF